MEGTNIPQLSSTLALLYKKCADEKVFFSGEVPFDEDNPTLMMALFITSLIESNSSADATLSGMTIGRAAKRSIYKGTRCGMELKESLDEDVITMVDLEFGPANISVVINLISSEHVLVSPSALPTDGSFVIVPLREFVVLCKGEKKRKEFPFVNVEKWTKVISEKVLLKDEQCRPEEPSIGVRHPEPRRFNTDLGVCKERASYGRPSLEIGRSDWDPFAPPSAPEMSGMLMGRPSEKYQQQHLPPGAVPPGAKFDEICPVGPPLPPIPSTGPSSVKLPKRGPHTYSGEPDNDELLPPGGSGAPFHRPSGGSSGFPF